MTIEKQVVMRLDVIRGQQRAFADAANDARRLRDNMPRAQDAAGLDLAARRAKEMSLLVDGATQSFRRLRSEMEATNQAARRLTAEPGAGGPLRLVNGVGPGGTQRLLPGPGGATPPIPPGAAPPTRPPGAGGIGDTLAGAGLAAAAGAIAQAVARAVSEALRTEADPQIAQIRSRDRTVSGMATNIADSSVRGLPGVGPAVGAYWDAMSYEEPSRMGRNADAFIRGATFGTVSLGLQGGGSRRSLERSNQALARAQENRERIRTEQGIYGQQYQAMGQLQSQGRNQMFGAQADAGLSPMRVNTQLALAAQQRREQQVFGAMGMPIAGDLTYGRQAFGSAAAGLQGEIGRQGPNPFAADLERNRREMEFQRNELQSARNRYSGAGETSDRSGRINRGQQSSNRLTVDAGQGEALQAQLQASQRLVELERQRGQLTQQAAQAEGERLNRIREQATAGAQAYRAQAQAEQLRQQGMREQFGSMSELQRRQVLQVSRAVRAGQQLTPEQERIARENGGIFEGALRQINNRRAQQGGFDEVSQNVGLDQRQREAERRAAQLENIAVQANTQVTATLQASATADANAIAQQLAPLILQALQAQAAQIGQATQRQLEEQATRPQTTVVQ